MDIDFEHVEFEVLRTLHAAATQEPLEGRLNGASWEAVTQKTYELVKIETTLYKRLEHRLTPAEAPVPSFR